MVESPAFIVTATARPLYSRLWVLRPSEGPALAVHSHPHIASQVRPVQRDSGRRRVAFSATDLKLVIDEVAPALIEGWIQKIYQPAARVLVLEFRVRGATYRLLMSCEPETARLHLAQHRLRNPPTPPSFCQFLRAHLEGARLHSMRQLNDDRVVALEFTTKAGAGASSVSSRAAPPISSCWMNIAMSCAI